MIAFIKKHPVAVLMLVSILMLFSHLGLIQTNIMEVRNLISAREMVEDGHWIFTTLNNAPRYEKPPLPTWITAVFMLIAGTQNMFWLRLPVVLMCLMLVYFFYKLAREMKMQAPQPLNASLILITSFYIFFAGRDNQWDMYTHAFMIACIFYLFKVLSGSGYSSRNVLLAGLFFGCSFLSKGPVSVYAFLLPFLIAYFIVYRGDAGRKLLNVLFVFLIGLIIGLSWPLYVKYFDIYAGNALANQAANWTSYEVKPFWYYWSFFTQSGIWTIPSFVSLMYFYMRKRVENIKVYNLTFLWTVLSVILLSLIPEKKARYLLPVLIPLAMNTSFYIQYLINKFKTIKNKAEAGIVYFSFGLIAVIAFVLPFAVFFLFKTKLSGFIIWYTLLLILSLVFGFLIMQGLYKKNFAQTFYSVIFFMCGIVIVVIPLSKIYYDNNEYYSAANLHTVEKKLDIKTYEGDGFEPEITWDYGDYIPSLNDAMPASSAFGLLIHESNMDSLQQKLSNYSFEKYAQVDLNALSKNEKGYNERLVKNYYLLRKK